MYWREWEYVSAELKVSLPSMCRPFQRPVGTCRRKTVSGLLGITVQAGYRCWRNRRGRPVGPVPGVPGQSAVGVDRVHRGRRFRVDAASLGGCGDVAAVPELLSAANTLAAFRCAHPCQDPLQMILSQCFLLIVLLVC